jgi:hypothetical protein
VQGVAFGLRLAGALGQRAVLVPQRTRARNSFELALQFAVHEGAFRLAAHGFALALQFAQHIFHARQVHARRFEVAQGVLASGAIQRDACDLFEPAASLVGRGGQQRVDVALPDNCVAAAPQPRAREQIGDIAQAGRRAVNPALPLARTVQAARDLHLVGVHRQPARLVVEPQRRLRQPQRFVRRRTAEQHFRRRLRPQRAHIRLAQCPHQRVH